MTDSKDMKQTSKPTETYWVQTIIGILSVLLVSALIGWITIDLFDSNETPPDLSVESTHVTKVGAGWLVEFEVTNTASETAAEVGIEADLSTNREKVEEASATLDYVPGHSTARGGLFFSQNPAEFELQIRAVGYRKP